MRKLLVLAALGVLTIGSGAPFPAPTADAAARGCAPKWHGGGGDWPTKGHDTYNTNFQPKEKKIGPANLLQLELKWVAPQPSIDPGTWTPAVSGSCVYVSGLGTLYALDAETGKLVWVGTKRMTYGGGAEGEAYPPRTVTVEDGLVHVDADNKRAPRGYAYDARTGRLVWESESILFGYPANQFAAAKVFDGIHLLFTTGPDFDPKARPGYAFLDAKTGEVLVKDNVTPDRLLEKGYAGSGVWVDPAIDPVGGYAFAGTANPYNSEKESDYDDAIVKIDMDRDRKTFGQVVGNYKGDPDQGLDIDFAGGPTLFPTESGDLWLAETQKSATLHVIDTKTMKLQWKFEGRAGGPLFGNAGEPAYDGERLYVLLNPGVLYAFDPETGNILWAEPLQDDPLSARPPVVANGVVYTIGGGGKGTVVLAHDAATGAPLGALAPSADTGIDCAAGSNGGLSIAHHMLYVNCQAYLAAYGLPEG
jgi:outer membrane protein assembly factor BamB